MTHLKKELQHLMTYATDEIETEIIKVEPKKDWYTPNSYTVDFTYNDGVYDRILTIDTFLNKGRWKDFTMDLQQLKKLIGFEIKTHYQVSDFGWHPLRSNIEIFVPEIDDYRIWKRCEGKSTKQHLRWEIEYYKDPMKITLRNMETNRFIWFTEKNRTGKPISEIISNLIQ